MKLETEKYELFEELAEKFRFRIVALLKNILSNTNLSDDEKRAICSDFLAEFCANLDQSEWTHGSDFYRPILAFVGGNNLQIWNDSTTIYAPYEAYHHHDKVWGEVDEHYDRS